MTQEKMVENAIEEFSKEKQEAKIKKIKDIVRSYLEKIDDKKLELRKVQDDLKALESDLNDLKTGRLDKIEERQGSDKTHDRNTIIIVERIEKEYIPYQPWRSPWTIEWKYRPEATIGITGGNTYYLDTTGSTLTNTSGPLTAYSSLLQNSDTASDVITGLLFQNFSGGSYNINDHIINL